MESVKEAASRCTVICSGGPAWRVENVAVI